MLVCNKYLLKIWRALGALPFRFDNVDGGATIVGTSRYCLVYCVMLMTGHTSLFAFTLYYYDNLRTKNDIEDASSNVMYYIIWILATLCSLESLVSRNKTLTFVFTINRIDSLIPSHHRPNSNLILALIVYFGYGFIQVVRFCRYPTYLNACYDLGNLIIFTSQMNAIFTLTNITNRQTTFNKTIKIIFNSKHEIPTIYGNSKEIGKYIYFSR